MTDGQTDTYAIGKTGCILQRGKNHCYYVFELLPLKVNFKVINSELVGRLTAYFLLAFHPITSLYCFRQCVEISYLSLIKATPTIVGEAFIFYV